MRGHFSYKELLSEKLKIKVKIKVKIKAEGVVNITSWLIKNRCEEKLYL